MPSHTVDGSEIRLTTWDGAKTLLNNRITGWWFQIFFYFHPDPWGNDPILTI